MTPATLIQNYLLLHIAREFPGLDVWRANVVAAKAGQRFVRAGEPGQADLTGVSGRWCKCGYPRDQHTGNHEFIPTGRSVWIEIKYGHDRQNQAQRDFERRVTRLGALYIICKVKHENTLDQIRILTAKPLPVHPAEIQAFFNELREKL